MQDPLCSRTDFRKLFLYQQYRLPLFLKGNSFHLGCWPGELESEVPSVVNFQTMPVIERNLSNEMFRDGGMSEMNKS